jgi:TRAP-type C4-dicarboxylate transport system permease small subunit
MKDTIAAGSPLQAALRTVTAGFYKLLELIMVLCLAGALLMVFGNVVLRAAFNTGLDLSEELPRYLMVWLIFLGTVVALRDRAHLGMDTVLRKLGVRSQRVCWVICQVLMAACGLYILYGTWLQHDILANNVSPVAQLSTIWVFGVSYVTGTAITLHCLFNLVRMARGQVRDDELIEVEEEGMHEARAIETSVENAAAMQRAGGTLGAKP